MLEKSMWNIYWPHAISQLVHFFIHLKPLSNFIDVHSKFVRTTGTWHDPYGIITFTWHIRNGKRRTSVGIRFNLLLEMHRLSNDILQEFLNCSFKRLQYTSKKCRPCEEKKIHWPHKTRTGTRLQSIIVMALYNLSNELRDKHEVYKQNKPLSYSFIIF